MTPKSAFRFLHSSLLPSLLIALSFGVSLPACSRKPTAKAGSSSQAASAAASDDAPEIQIDKTVFHFDYKMARSLVIDKADPVSGDHWIARVERQQQSPSAFYEDDSWVIASYSENPVLPDRLANRSLILHLLDTLSTLHPIEATPSSPEATALEEARSNDGLSPPRYALRWEVWDAAAGRLRTFQVEIGGPIEQSGDTNRLAYGTFPPDQRIFKLDGAALPMLEYIKNFSVLRDRTVSPLAADQVDEIEIRRQGKSAFYAQRDGYVWADKKHRPWKKDVQGFLDRITHLRIENFIDDPRDVAQLMPAVEKTALEEIVLKGRSQKTTEIRLARLGKRELASVSTRPGAVFALYAGALSRLSP